MIFKKPELSLFFLVLSLLATNTAFTKEKVTIHVDDGYPPMSYKSKSGPKGYYIIVLTELSERMDNFELEIVAVPWPRGKKMLVNGSAFGLMPAYYHGHDWKYTSPYSLKITDESVNVYCLKSILSGQKRNLWPKDYIGLKVANIAGFDGFDGFDGYGSDEFRQLVKEDKIKYFEVKASDSALLLLIYGRVECVMMSAQAFDLTYQKLKKKGQIKTGSKEIALGAEISSEGVYIAYSKKKIKENQDWALDFRIEVDNAIYSMVKDGSIKKIWQEFVKEEEAKFK